MSVSPGPTANWKALAIAGAALIVLLAVAVSGTGSSSAELKQAGAPARRVVDSATLRAQAAAEAARKEAEAKELASLKKHFVFDADSIEGGGWYSHRSQTVDNSWNRTYLKVNVAADGTTYLTSKYTGDDWIFHDRMIVKVDSALYRSDIIPSYSDLNSHSNSGGQVWEQIHFTAGQDNGALAAIAAADSAAVIRVRFEGDEHVRDFTLSRRDRDAIRAGYRLGQLLRASGNQ